MNRRRYAEGVVSLLLTVSGCSTSETEDEYIRSTVNIVDRYCDETDSRVEITDYTEDNVVEFEGIMPEVTENETLKSSVYTSDEDNKIICLIQTVDSTTEADCVGSIKYTGSIIIQEGEYISVNFLHSNNGVREIVGEKALSQ